MHPLESNDILEMMDKMCNRWIQMLPFIILLMPSMMKARPEIRHIQEFIVMIRTGSVNFGLSALFKIL